MFDDTLPAACRAPLFQRRQQLDGTSPPGCAQNLSEKCASVHHHPRMDVCVCIYTDIYIYTYTVYGKYLQNTIIVYRH